MNIDMAVDVISGHEPLPQFKAIPPVPDLRRRRVCGHRELVGVATVESEPHMRRLPIYIACLVIALLPAAVCQQSPGDDVKPLLVPGLGKHHHWRSNAQCGVPCARRTACR